jgi:glutaredoxin 3
MTAPRVRIYTLSGCGPCARARRLLRWRGIGFDEVCGDDDPAFGRLLRERTGGLTVPQIVIDDVPIGGADSLERLDRLGLLPQLLGHESFPLARIVRRLSLRRMLDMYLSGGATGPWSYRVELVDQRGQVLERRQASSAEEAVAIAASLGPAVSSDIASPATNGGGPGR